MPAAQQLKVETSPPWQGVGPQTVPGFSVRPKSAPAAASLQPEHGPTRLLHDPQVSFASPSISGKKHLDIITDK